MTDKIIQIISHRETIVGLSESGIVYKWLLTDEKPRWQWVKETESPTRKDTHAQ